MNARPSGRVIAARYAAFALVATGVNLGTQFLSSRVYAGPGEFWVALLAGTAAGLLVKYLLDKNYIFYYKTIGIAENLGRFLLYSLAGGVTTLVFWGTELLFETVFPWHGARYAGGALGLACGYTAKYFIDKRFVFRTREDGP